MKMETIEEQRVWASPSSLDFFSRERRSPDDLYPSERIFLPDAVRRAGSVLDVGCACGGFAAIMRAFNGDINYVGVDIVPEMLARASRDDHDSVFAAAAGHALPFKNRTFDLVHCSGATHLNSRYRELIADMWRTTRKELLFDMRLTDGASTEGIFRVDFNRTGKGQTLPYIVVNIDEVCRLIDGLEDAPASVQMAGYRHPPSKTADFSSDDNLIMAFLLLQREAYKTGWHIDIADTPSS